MAKCLELEWVYRVAEPKPEILTLEALEAIGTDKVIPPPQEELEQLYKLTMFGDMEQVQAKADEIEQMDSQYLAFAHIIRDYAQKLEDELILYFLSQYIE